MPAEVFLLVQDNPHDAFLFNRALKGARPESQLVVLCTLKSAFAYLAALCKVPTQQVHTAPFLMAVDLAMPDGRGGDLVRWARAQPALKDLHVIVVTGSENHEDASEAASLGVASFFIKPPGTEGLSSWLAGLREIGSAA